jgi:uncharacterized phage infection (PIP) family protein YhgE
MYVDGEGTPESEEETPTGEAAEGEEETPEGETPEGEEETPEGETPEGEDDGEEEEEPWDEERARATIKAQRESENALKDQVKTLSRDLRQARKRVGSLEAEESGQVETLNTRVEELENQLSESNATVERYRDSAREATFLTSVDLPQPDVAYSLIPRTGVALEWDDKTDQPKNLKQVQRALIQKYPHLFGEPGVGGGDGRSGGGSSANGMNDLMRDSIGR